MQGRTIFLAILTAATLAAQPPARVRTPALAPITAITITGNKTIPTDAILAASSLKLNHEGSAAIFDATRDRLLNTGYFDTVSYSFEQKDLGFAVTFTVAEMKQVYSVRAEALPLTQDQLTQLLRTTQPLFYGLLPGTKPVLDRASAAIEQFLAPTNPGLRVRARVVAIAAERLEIQFTPAEGLPVIADITFEGSDLISPAELHIAAIENAIGQPFSDSGIQTLLDRVIRPLYEKHGRMRVKFGPITTQPAASVKGLNVHVTVTDGPTYKLTNVTAHVPEGPAPAGGQALDARRIVRMAALPALDKATYDDVVQSAPRVLDSLRGEGFLDATVTPNRTLNDADQTITAWYDVTTGEIYHFGHLDVIGLGLDGEAAIRKMWAVKPGDPFPASYQDRFVKGVKAEGLFDNLGDITCTPTINRQTRVVDVMLYFSTAPAAPPRRAQF